MNKKQRSKSFFSSKITWFTHFKIIFVWYLSLQLISKSLPISNFSVISLAIVNYKTNVDRRLPISQVSLKILSTYN